MLKRAGLALMTMLLGPQTAFAEPVPEGAPAAAPAPPPPFVKMNGETGLAEGADPNAPRKPVPPKRVPAGRAAPKAPEPGPPQPKLPEPQ